MKIDMHALRHSWHDWIRNDGLRPPGPWWLPWLWTLLFSLALAVPFTAIGFLALGSGTGAWRNWAGWGYWYGRNWIVCVTVASTIHLLFDAGRLLLATPLRLKRWQPWQRSIYFASVPMIGLAIGWPLGVLLAGGNFIAWINSPGGANMVAGGVLVGLLISLALHFYFATKTRQIEAERRATEAQLKLLQAQIEPHFLFNTLANVQSLMDHDLPKARRILSDFTDYLRASLGTLRNSESTVANELALAQSYLQLLQGRMEERLQFSIEADDAARRLPLPPLLLQPLVENAVVHGLEPSIAGGSIRVTARTTNGQLVLEVQDDGRGLDAAPRRGGAGLALQNIRQRLQARHRGAAQFELRALQPGTLARITLPLESTA